MNDFRERLGRWLAGERKKLEGKTLPQKAGYIIGYYWLWMTGAAVAVSLLVFAVYRANFTVKDYWIYGIMANASLTGSGPNEIQRDFTLYGGYNLREKNVLFNTASWFDPTKPGGTNNSYYQAYVAVTEAGDLDFLTMEEDGLAAVGSSGRLLDLNSEKCGRIRELYADRFVYCVPYDTEYSEDPVPVGIDISDSRLVTDYHLYEDSCVLGIAAYTGNLEAVEQFLEFVLTPAAGDAV